MSRITFMGRSLRSSLRVKLSMQEKGRILKRLAQLHQHGYSILESLQIMRRAVSVEQQEMIDMIIEKLEQGEALAQACQIADFSPYVQQVLGEAEQHGQLAEALQKASLWMERRMKLKKEWQKVLTYPVLLLLLLFLMSYLIFILVIPQFQAMFFSFHLELPLSTQLTLRFFQFIAAWYLPMLLGLGLMAGAGLLLLRQPSSRVALLRVLLQFPLTKKRLQWYYTSSFAHQLGDFLQANIPLYESMASLSNSSSSLVMQEELQIMQAKLLKGAGLSEAVRDSSIFLADMYLLIYYAERNGNLGRELYQYGVELEDEAIQSFMEGLRWVEPILLVGIGILIAFLFISLFSPILQLIEVL